LFYQIALMGRKDLPLAPTSRVGLEMVLLRMLAFQPATAEIKMPSQQAQPQPTPTPNKPISNTAVTENKTDTTWADIVKNLNLSGMTAAIASHCILEKLSESEIILAVEPKQSILLNKKQEERLSQALQSYFNRTLRLTIHTGQADMPTPAAVDHAVHVQQKSEALEAIAQDQNVQNIIAAFNAQILPDSVTARGKGGEES
jgi:DNA polymerase-3 subunit gamma/tau